jgi:hypothetical protein
MFQNERFLNLSVSKKKKKYISFCFATKKTILQLIVTTRIRHAVFTAASKDLRLIKSKGQGVKHVAQRMKRLTRSHNALLQRHTVLGFEVWKRLGVLPVKLKRWRRFPKIHRLLNACWSSQR